MKLVRALWWLCLVAALIILVGALPGYWEGLNAAEPSAEFSQVLFAARWLGLGLSIASAVLCLGLAALLFVKKPNDRMALFLAFYLLWYGILLVGPLEHSLPFWFPSSGALGLARQGLTLPLPTIILILIFPNGKFAPRWTCWLVGATAGVLLCFLSTIRDPSEVISIHSLAAKSSFALFAAVFVTAFGAQFYRYFKLYTPLERQQTKWVLFGLVFSYLLIMLVSIPYTLRANLPPGAPVPWWMSLSGLGWWFALMIQPLALTIAILRARLWDIDIVIRRTVTYALVVALLLVVYFGSVVLLQQIFATVSGQRSEIITVLSTLAIAALFVPLRNRVQATIDKRFYRKKYNAQQVLHDFAETVRDETDFDKLTGKLIEVVNETMQPNHASVWLKQEPGKQGDK